MRVGTVAGLAAALTIAACVTTDGGSMAPSAPNFAHNPTIGGMADLIVDAKQLATSWVIYEQVLKDNQCALIEGGVEPGSFHRVLRMTVTTPNIGDGDIFLGDPAVHVAQNDGLYELSDCHHHWHFRNYARYELVNPFTHQTVQAKKRGFCMIDTTPWQHDDVSPGSWVYRSCGRPAIPALGLDPIPGNQGISVGWADQYYKWLGGQFFILDDPNEFVAPGKWLLRVTVNPDFPCTQFDIDHGRLRSDGKCHNFEESRYDNNVAEVLIDIPDHPGKTGFGPGGGQAAPDKDIVDDENRPGTSK